MIGQKVLGYRVEELIGRGSFATVYKVKKENESGTYVRALKRIIIPDEEQYRRIWNAMGHDKRKTDLYFQNVFEETMQEIQLMHAFTENGVKNVVACYENDVIRHMDPIQYEIYILMEYLTPLSDYICNHDLNVEELIDIGVQILDALEVCHANHIIHRDIKEANIFVTPNGIYKLGDFGVAAIQNEQRFVSSIKGTAGYMAPEVYHKSEKYDESVDLYSLGIVLYGLDMKEWNKSRDVSALGKLILKLQVSGFEKNEKIAIVDSQELLKPMENEVSNMSEPEDNKIALTKDDVMRIVSAHYNEQLTDGGYYIIYNAEGIETETGFNFPLHYQLSEEEAQKIVDEGGTPSANRLVGYLDINTESGMVTPDFDEPWNLYD